MYKFLQSLETQRFRGLFHFRANGQPLDIVDWLFVAVICISVIIETSKPCCQKLFLLSSGKRKGAGLSFLLLAKSRFSRIAT